MPSTMSERERWAAAARMLEMYGDEVGPILLNRVQRLLENDDQPLAYDWIDISQKVERLHSAEGFA